MTSDQLVMLKAKIRERDGLRCTECGMTNEKHLADYGSSLQVHRVTPGSEYSEEAGVCVTLCRDCHGPKPRRPRGTLPKPDTRLVRIPEAFAAVLDEFAAEQFNSLTEQVKIACREYLERHDRLPKPTKKPRPD